VGEQVIGIKLSDTDGASQDTNLAQNVDADNRDWENVD